MRKNLLLIAMTMGMYTISHAQNDLAKITNFKSSDLLKEPQQQTILQAKSQASFRVTKTLEHWKKLRRAGAILTGVGVGSIAGGIALIAVGNNENNRDYNYGGYDSYYYDDMTDGDGKIVAGALGIVGGITALGGGITMLAIGNNRVRKYTDRVKVDFGARGAKLAYRF